MGAYVLLLLVLLSAGALMAGATAYLMARGLTRPPRMTDGKAAYLLGRLSPKDLSLDYEATTFDVRDQASGRTLRLAAWWIPLSKARPASRTVLIVHGYADAKVGAIAWAPVWHELGFNLLAIDLRAHGESGGVLCSGGYYERHDLVQVVHQLLAREPAATRQIILFGASLGAAAAAGAAELLEPDGLPTALVLESPFADFRTATSAHFDRMSLPGGFIRRWAVELAQWMTQSDFSIVRPPDTIRRARCAVLALLPEEDLYLSDHETTEFQAAFASRPASSGPSACHAFAGVDHLMAVVEAPEAYRAAISGFVDSLPRSPPG